MYTDISTFFTHIVLNDGQWSVDFVLDSNGLTDPSGIMKDIERFNTRKLCREEDIEFDPDTLKPTHKDEREGYME